MAIFPLYNPVTEEAISAPIGGMSNAITQLSNALSMKTSSLVDESMSEIFIDDTDRRRLYAVSIEKRGWLENPSPVIKKNNVVISPVTDSFKIHHLGGCIEFLNSNTRPSESDVITVTATYINGSSARLDTIESEIATIEEGVKNYRGAFTSLANLKSTITDPKANDYAHVFGTVFDIYFYDTVSTDWVSVTQNDVDSLTARIVALENGKEPKITTKNTAFNKNFGTGNGDVMRGDYAYSKLQVDTFLTGYEPKRTTQGTAYNKNFGNIAGTVMEGSYAYSKLQVDNLLDDKEPTFAKNTAFNKNFGTGNGDVMRGDYAYSKAQVNTSISGRAPTSHATTSTTYGIGTGTNYGHTKLSDSVSSTSSVTSGIAATPKAVKTAYDLAYSKAPTNHATTATTYGVGTSTNYGHLRLSDLETATSGTSNGTAATPYAVKKVNDKIINALDEDIEGSLANKIADLDLGKAPSGYGLGGYAKNIANISEAIVTGFYFGTNVVGSPFSNAYVFIEVVAASASTRKIIVTDFNDFSNVRVGGYLNGVLKAWVNPYA